jgi:hypothetical protein
VANIFGTYSNNWGNRQNQPEHLPHQQDSTYNSGPLRSWRTEKYFQGGTDFFVSPKHTIGILVTGNISDYHMAAPPVKTEIYVKEMKRSPKYYLQTMRLTATSATSTSTAITVFADTSGHELTADCRLRVFTGTPEQLSTEHLYSCLMALL